MPRGSRAIKRRPLDDAHHDVRHSDDLDLDVDAPPSARGGACGFPSPRAPPRAPTLMAASGYSEPGRGLASDLRVPLTKLAVDERDPWAASTAPQLQSQLEDAGFTLSLIPARSGGAAGRRSPAARPTAAHPARPRPS